MNDETEERKQAREALERVVGEPIWNARNYPEPAQVHILGRNISKLRTAVVDALLAAGVRVTAVEPNPEERERIARHFANRRVGRLSANEHDYAEADALRAAGFGDVAAERAEAVSLATMLDTAHVDLDLLENRLEQVTIERDALQARIDAAPHGEPCSSRVYVFGMKAVSGHPCDCWKSSALTVDEPAPEPSAGEIVAEADAEQDARDHIFDINEA